MGSYLLLWVLFCQQQEPVFKKPLLFTPISLGEKLSKVVWYLCLGKTGLFILEQNA